MNEDEKYEVARAGLDRVREILDGVPDLQNGKPLPPEAQAEIELIFAKARVLGVLPEGRPSDELAHELDMIVRRLRRQGWS
ncbi:hypothetical protein [Microbispora sp. NPDC049125]|uniref:hypothetical protein n=1 Tax=Microbispora sp. NPDC049125 TaxID=3154929 RepID=UPI0034667898